jgi:hypothetical protein
LDRSREVLASATEAERAAARNEESHSMRTECPQTKTVLAGIGIFGLAVAGFGCSDDGTTDGTGGAPNSGAGGTGLVATGGSVTGGSATGGSATGGQAPTGGVSGSAGAGSGTGGTVAGSSGSSTGGSGTGGSGMGGADIGGAGMGGAGNGGASMGGAGRGGSGMGGGGKGGTAGSAGKGSGGTGGSTGTCTASKSTGKSASGSGPHDVVVETNTDEGIRCGTIYRPADLGGAEKYPIFVWGEGGCSQNGYSNFAAMSEIASWGYFVVADGTPNGTNPCQSRQNGQPFLDYITWAIAENGKSCSAYAQSLETTKIAADGFSCGGLMAENASDDPRFTAIGITSSGLTSPSAATWDAIHTPFKIMNGGESDVAYPNGLRDYEEISSRGIPILYFSKTSAGHGGDLGQARGDFNRVNLAWLNWQLKGDMGATGKGFLYGSTCQFCTDSGWDYRSANIQ